MSAALVVGVQPPRTSALDAEWLVAKVRDDVLSPVEASVLRCLAVRCHGDEERRVSIDGIIAFTKFHRRTLSEALNGLARKGLVSLKHERLKGPAGQVKHLPSLVRLQLQALRQLPQRAWVPLDDESDEGGEPVPSPKAPSRGQGCPGGEGPRPGARGARPQGLGPWGREPGPHSEKKKKDLDEEIWKKGEAEPPLEGTLGEPTLEARALGWWAEAYEGKYGTAPIERPGDAKVVAAVVGAARAQAEAYRARCAERGEPVEGLGELVEACVQRWLQSFLSDAGSVSERCPGGYLASRRHPLSCWMGDLERYGTPWSCKEKRQAAERAEEERVQREAEARERQRAQAQQKWALAAQKRAERAAQAPVRGALTAENQAAAEPLPERVGEPLVALAAEPPLAAEASRVVDESALSQQPAATLADEPSPAVEGPPPAVEEPPPAVDEPAAQAQEPLPTAVGPAAALAEPCRVDASDEGAEPAPGVRCKSQPEAQDAASLAPQVEAVERLPLATRIPQLAQALCPGGAAGLAANDPEEPASHSATPAAREEMRRVVLEVQRQQLANLLDDGQHDRPEDIRRRLAEAGLGADAPPTLPSLRADHASAQQAQRTAAQARALQESRALAVWLPEREAAELLALLDRPRPSLSRDQTRRLNTLMCRAIQAKEQQGSGL